uniref:Uncharacterized protein n=1 Tax=Burkholderia cenocepacia TaxID=95486 RepID=A0A071MD57_9BURK
MGAAQAVSTVETVGTARPFDTGLAAFEQAPAPGHDRLPAIACKARPAGLLGATAIDWRRRLQ